MLAAIVHRRQMAYRCPGGCWWEKDGCFCPDTALTLRGLGASSGVGTIVGLALVGAVIWGAVGVSKLTKRGRRR